MMTSWTLIACGLLVGLPIQARPSPAALVVEVSGQVEVRPADGPSAPLAVGDLVYPGERVVVPAGGSASLALLDGGAREALKPGAEATVNPGGCTPPGAVAGRKEPRRSVAATLKGVRPAADGRKAGVSFRGDVEAPAIVPILDATVASDRPDFAWPPAEGVKAYRVRLLVKGSNRVVWKVESAAPRLAYPEGKPGLERGKVYLWEVADAETFRAVASGEFSVATASERAQLEELAEAAKSEDRGERYLAALSYRRLHAFAEAIAVLEGLATQAPEVAAYREALTELRRQAGMAPAASLPAQDDTP